MAVLCIWVATICYSHAFAALEMNAPTRGAIHDAIIAPAFVCLGLWAGLLPSRLALALLVAWSAMIALYSLATLPSPQFPLEAIVEATTAGVSLIGLLLFRSWRSEATAASVARRE